MTELDFEGLATLATRPRSLVDQAGWVHHFDEEGYYIGRQPLDDHGHDAPGDNLLAEHRRHRAAPPEVVIGVDHGGKDRSATAIFVGGQQGQRRYLPTLADLVDRLSIAQLKAVFIPEHAAEYRSEIADIMHDIDLILREHPPLDAEAVRAIAVVMLTNRFIWENESKARAGGPEQDRLLKLTHSVNGIRNTAKNVIASKTGGRKDYKIDAFAADLPAEFGNWNVFK